MVNVIPPILISGNMLRQRKSLHAHLIVANTAFLTHSPRRCTCRGRIYRNWRVWSDIFLRTALINTRMKVVGSIMSPFGCILVVNRCCSSCFLIIAAICGARSLFLAAIFTSRGLCRGIGSKRMRRRWFWCGTGSADSMVSTCTFRKYIQTTRHDCRLRRVPWGGAGGSPAGSSVANAAGIKLTIITSVKRNAGIRFFHNPFIKNPSIKCRIAGAVRLHNIPFYKIVETARKFMNKL